MDQIGVQLGRVVERERARAELERSNADLEAFAYVASHDLAEPLRSVAGFVALLERQYGDRLDDRAREFIAYAVDGVERMQRMIDDLLLYARAGTTELRCERVDAGEVVAGALRDLETAVAERGAVVEVGELPARAAATPGQLQRVFLNLLGNAIKFTAPGVAPRVTVSGRSGRRGAEIAVADNGIGIDPAQVERAFEMFARIPGRQRRSTRAPASGWPSRGGSSSATAGACGSSPTPAGAACSRLRPAATVGRGPPLARLRRSPPARPSSPSWSASSRSCSASSTPSGPSWSPTGRATSTSSSHYLDRVFLHFDLGTSYERGLGFQPITPLLRAAFPADLSLVVGGLVAGRGGRRRAGRRGPAAARHARGARPRRLRGLRA